MNDRDQLRFGVLIVAAGRGERAGSPEEGPKQYRRIGGLRVITHTIRTFASWKAAPRIVVAIHRDDEALFEAARASFPPGIDIRTVFGGATRQASVLLGLEAIAGYDVTHVMIHDAVRP